MHVLRHAKVVVSEQRLRDALLASPPQTGHSLKGVGLIEGAGQLGITLELAGVFACRKRLASLVPRLPGLGQGHIGIDTQRKALLFASLAVLPAPVLAPDGGHLQIEGFFIGQADAGAPFGASGLLARCIGQGHFGGTFLGASENPDLCPQLCPPKIADTCAR